MSSYDLLTASVVATYLSIDVSHHDGNISSWAVLNDSGTFAAEIFFYILITVIGWDLTLNDLHVDLPFLVWKVALRILGPCASHPVSALCAVLASGCVMHFLLHDLIPAATPL